ncbi:hypothetical protein SDA22_10100 [Legionella pneumophila serogroup 1]|uniref:hypothetical protein n=1 Tax=Legionella pneumophila TaxID=446 RepID=UPI0007709431|nr:hypothetical protein [Legionella pneumophila]CZH38803.1 Uncharacterised protein [Legionella pneumophila]HAT1982588.1 hypothetical protein [Legionella pneumophila]HAT4424913.1 hypothetical protein [Legionella pneumophila]HAU1720826.1 hypothetical protein [Legionella pneumophila]HAU2287404.1 hypothetical protein [Legionella pneumophila]
METVFLETNAINSCYLGKYSGKELSKALSMKNLIPIISQHTTYELGRNFLSPINIQLGISLFSILKGLNPTYSCQTMELLKRGIKKLTLDIACDFIIEKSNFYHLQKAISEICQGNISEEWSKYISTRESEIINNQTIWNHLFQTPKTTDFENFFQNIINDRKNIIFIIQELCNEQLNPVEAENLILKLDQFKAIKTAIRANLYMCFLARNHKTAPSKDKTDDFRHLIDASLCTYFATDDNNLIKYARIIIPELRIMTFADLIN